MDVSLREDGSEVVIVLKGRFDEVAVAERRFWFDRIASEATKNICLDLSEVTVMDSSAVGTIAFMFKRLAARQNRLSLAGATGQPLELLKFLRIDRVIAMRFVSAPHPGASVKAYGTTAKANSRDGLSMP